MMIFLVVQSVFTRGCSQSHRCDGPWPMNISNCPSPFNLFISRFLLWTQVSWVRRKEEQLHLITFGASTYISDSRYSLEFKEPNDWQLHIQYANERDEGQFECQINTSPPLVVIVYLEVIGKDWTLLKLFMPCLRRCRQWKGGGRECRKIQFRFHVYGCIIFSLLRGLKWRWIFTNLAFNSPTSWHNLWAFSAIIAIPSRRFLL